MDHLLVGVGVAMLVGTVGLLVSFWAAFIALLVMAIVHLCNFRSPALSAWERVLGLALLAGLLLAIGRVVMNKLL